MAAKIVSQKKFSKLVASTGSLSQPPGSLPRLSNLLMTQRGSLQIADGSQAIATLAAPYIYPLALSTFSAFVAGQFPLYLAIARDPALSIAEFTPGTYAGGLSGGSSPTHVFFVFSLVAYDATGVLHNTPVTLRISGPIDSTTVTATFTLPSGATTVWVVYIPATFPSVAYKIGASTTSPVVGNLSVTTPDTTVGDNNSYSSQLEIGYTSAGGINFAVASGPAFPGPVIAPAQIAPGSPGFNYLAPYPGYSPYGGDTGVICPIPEILQFAGLSILILGNGVAPESVDPTTASPTPSALVNTFTAAYPTWQPAVAWLTGSQVTDGAGNYFTATQGGVSETPGPPSWSVTKGTETADGTVIWTSNGPVITPPAPRGAAHAVAYAGSLWLANTSPATTSDGIDGPTCLKMSDSNNPNSWNPVNTAFIGRDDGTQITGLQPFTIAALGISPTGSLCVFKEFTTYQVIGVFGSSSFEIQPAQTNLGCIAARSIQFLPGFGVCRFSHLGFAVFDGINDRLISEDIRPYLFGGVDSEADLTPVDPSFVYLAQSAQTIAPPMYLCAMPLAASPAGGTGSGMLTRLFCYDLVMKAWAVLDLPWSITTLTTIAVGEGYPLVLAGKTDGTLQRVQSGDLIWDAGAGDQSNVAWSFRSPDIFGEGSSQRLYYKTVVLRGYGNAAMVQSIVANLWIDGQNIGSQAIDIVPQNDGHLFECQIKIWLNGYRAHLDISGNNGGAPGVIDALDWQVVPKAIGTRRIIG